MNEEVNLSRRGFLRQVAAPAAAALVATGGVFSFGIDNALASFNREEELKQVAEIVADVFNHDLKVNADLNVLIGWQQNAPQGTPEGRKKIALVKGAISDSVGQIVGDEAKKGVAISYVQALAHKKFVIWADHALQYNAKEQDVVFTAIERENIGNVFARIRVAAMPSV